MIIETNRFCFQCCGHSTDSLKTAMKWHVSGANVKFYFDGKFVGNLRYAGHCKSEECLPDNGDYGTVYSAGDDNALYISYPQSEMEMNEKRLRLLLIVCNHTNCDKPRSVYTFLEV